MDILYEGFNAFPDFSFTYPNAVFPLTCDFIACQRLAKYSNKWTIA